MLKVIAVDKKGNILSDIELSRITQDDIAWFWVDFDTPTRSEISLLTTFFKFHELLIEDCLTLLQRPKIEISRQQIFLVSHVLKDIDADYETINMFVGKNYIVTFHLSPTRYIDKVIPKIMERGATYSPLHIMHMLVSEIVEGYIPIISKIENRLDEIEDNDAHTTKGSKIMDEVFDLRSDLLKLRRGLLPMRELIHRFLVSRRVEMTDNDRKYFHDIYDDLVQQTEIIEANRELASDIRENYMTYNSFKSNKIMTLLTVISLMFLPLTFIVGFYGMNFNMPEYETKYGYYVVCVVMMIIVFVMLWFFKKKGWLDTDW